MVLSPDELVIATDMKANIKTFAIISDSAIASSLKSAAISIPCTLSMLNGDDPTLLTVLRLDNATGQWVSIPNTVDTINHQIDAVTSEFSTLGVFIKAPTSAKSAKKKRGPLRHNDEFTIA
jgi:hypothetical protein